MKITTIKIFFIYFWTSIIVYSGTGQNSNTSLKTNRIAALNHYVEFSNTATHGLLIVHRLLELYNQEINKYVDLEGYKLNNYSNSDLPADIFEDKDHWFYPISPYVHFDNAIKHSTNLPPKYRTTLNERIGKMRRVIVALNNARFTVEQILASYDFSSRESLSEAYTALEECVDLYDRFHKEKKALQNTITIISQELDLSDPAQRRFMAFNQAFCQVMHDLREEKLALAPGKIQNLENGLKKIKPDIALLIQGKANGSELRNKIQNLERDIGTFRSGEPFDEQYQLYGRAYYFHNVIFLRDANHYGSGFIDRWNDFQKNSSHPVLLAFEEPHFYKVIYPEKSIDLAPIENNMTLLENTPDSLENRSLEIKQEALTIKADQVKIEVLDHRIVDGDIISLNFNGEWILRSYLLKAEPKELILDLLPGASNYLILHAENLGSIHPNTAAIHYFLNGKRTRVVLNSDLNVSEMIMINTNEK